MNKNIEGKIVVITERAAGLVKPQPDSLHHKAPLLRRVHDVLIALHRWPRS